MRPAMQNGLWIGLAVVMVAGAHVMGAQADRDRCIAAGRVLRRPCYQVELHHLPTGAVIAWTHTDESLARHLSRAEGIAAECAAADEQFRDGLPAARYDDVFPPSPSPSCGWCDFRRHCPEGAAASIPRRPWDGIAAT